MSNLVDDLRNRGISPSEIVKGEKIRDGSYSPIGTKIIRLTYQRVYVYRVSQILIRSFRPWTQISQHNQQKIQTEEIISLDQPNFFVDSTQLSLNRSIRIIFSDLPHYYA